jgi:3-phenylpropionate/cinnamic acid dioxygenase small subunit
MSAAERKATIPSRTNGSGRVSVGQVAAFLYQEARMLDEHDYEGWLALWDEDGVYWVPADGEETDPERHVSYVYDNRGRLGMRVKQLQTGYRYAQLPQSRTQHYIANVELLAGGGSRVEVRSSYLVIEARFGEMHLWPGRAIHELAVDEDSGFRIHRKTFVLINNDQPVPSMAFLP